MKMAALETHTNATQARTMVFQPSRAPQLIIGISSVPGVGHHLIMMPSYPADLGYRANHADAHRMVVEQAGQLLGQLLHERLHLQGVQFNI